MNHAWADPGDAGLTAYGVTLYGILDAGIAYQSHGAPLSAYYAQGLEYGISSNSNKSITSLAPNGLSPSRIGLTGTEPIVEDLWGIFTVETRFSPLSGEIANGPQSLVQNNRVPAASQTANGDSSQAGQFFSAAAFAGIKTASYGSLTVGRQNALLYDNVVAYDPQGGSYAFSLIGFSAVAAGAGDSEYNRLNNSLKYFYQIGPFHVGAQYQDAGEQIGGAAYEFNVGGSYERLSLEATYVNKKDAISLGIYSPTTSQLAALTAAGLSITSSLKATISDNESSALMASYDAGGLKAFAGYERIVYSNPDSPQSYTAVGATTIGGYYIGSVSAGNYVNDKVLQVSWTGLKYSLTPQVILTGAFYHYDQNSYASGKTTGCSTSAASSCSGTENAISLVAEYKPGKYLDLYGGVMKSGVSDGLASGFINTSTTSVTIGARLSF